MKAEGQIESRIHGLKSKADLTFCPRFGKFWTQEEIGKLFELDRSWISKIVTNFTSQLCHIQQLFYEKHKSVEEIAGFESPALSETT